jgi:hypothetical protein
MATDPTGGSWGLTPIGTPSVSTMPLAPKPVLTPDQIKQMRMQAMALQEPPKEGIHHWTQGLAELVRAIQGNREASFATDQEAQNREAQSKALMGMLPPTPSPGGPQPAAGAAPVGGATPGPSTGASSAADPRGMEPFIRETAAKYGVNPETAMKVAHSEGLKDFLGDDGKSGGAFQLYTGGGMGNDFQKETGLDPLDPKNERATIDYALKNVGKTGWLPFHGAAKVGVGPMEGIGQQTAAATPPGPIPAVPTSGGGPTIPATPVPPGGTPPEPVPLPNQPGVTAPGPPTTRMAFAGNPAAVPLPNPITQGASLPGANLSPMISAIAGRPMPPAGGGAPNPAAPVQVAGPPQAPSAPLQAAGGPLIPPHPSLESLRATIADPRVTPELKAMAVQQYQQMMQPQEQEYEGGSIKFIPGTGQAQWVSKPVYKLFKSPDGTEMQLRGSRTGPNEPMEWEPVTPGAGGPAKPGEPDYTTAAGRTAAAVAYKGAVKGAEEGATAQAKTYNTIHTGITGDAINAQRQAPVIDTLMKIAPAAFTGTGSDAALALNRLSAQLGIDPKGAAPRELFNMLSAKILGDQFAGIRNMAQEEGSPGGRVFKSMLDVEEKANITPEDSLAGVQAKLNYFKAMGKKVNDWADMADDYAQKNGHLDAGFMKTLRKDMGSAEFPSFTGETTKGETTTTAPAGFVGRTATNPKTKEKMREVAPDQWEPVK